MDVYLEMLHSQEKKPSFSGTYHFNRGTVKVTYYEEQNCTAIHGP